MAIFREYQKYGRDRSIEDRRRHKKLVEKSIKENIGRIISEESIIGQSNNKKIKIPIRGLKEYYFRYGSNQKEIFSGDGKEKKGDKYLINKYKFGKEEGRAGNEEGEDIYETEITIEEAIQYLFEDINLPYLYRKEFTETESESTGKKWGIQVKGAPPRLSKKHTVKERIKRKKQAQRNQVIKEGDRFPFHEEDLRYYRLKPKKKRDSNGVVICIMDTSGSMGQTKKYLARSFYFLLYQFLKIKYLNVEVVFIAHTTVAKEVSEDEFFHKAESGGTYISSGYKKALEIIHERYNPKTWNIYAFHCSDGDNWGEDNQRAVEAALELCKVCNLFGYGEIKTSTYTSTIMQKYMEEIKEPNFAMVKIAGKEDVWAAFVELLNVEKNNRLEG
ncbi:MAG: YeaH/YhbH family protein [Epulopiscium sp.]|nr:YeaH/YhbH family protein [Candidatus Epulonipiscium sp.]HOQ17092.1 YeaH/YhbH family protein [Defluviitaleaceae bacterium]HPT77029.1 YeaH/YhbH family protein [Defluviitaleaceae bacterium]